MLASNYSERYKKEIAVVTPIYGHSGLLCEAIESVLAQESDFCIRLVLVNDGCRFMETESVCLDYATAYPDRITYLRKRNGGLSDARNHGARYILANLPNVFAIYFLDSDNRIRPPALARAAHLLIEDPTIGWIYPNIDMFGLSWAGDYDAPYSILLQTAMNTCEAGSLVRREVFEQDVYFDTSMRLGFEDWDFFLTASEKGFSGKNLPNFGFQYRKRPESMLADSTRDQDEIKGGMLRKHAALTKIKNLLSLEHKELPRYAIYLADRHAFFYCVDPNHTREVAAEEYEQAIWRSVTSLNRHSAPPYLIVTTSQAFTTLKRSRLLHWALWRLEIGLDGPENVAMLSLTQGSTSELSVSVINSDKGEHLQAQMAMIDFTCLREVLGDPKTNWIDTLSRENPDPRVLSVNIALPKFQTLPATLQYQSVLPIFLHTIQWVHGSKYRPSSSFDWGWREPGMNAQRTALMAARSRTNGRAVLPRLTADKPSVAFILPLLEFGGVEKVAINLAKAFGKAGWTTHLLITERRSAQVTRELFETFESILFLDDDSALPIWNEKSMYLGTSVPSWATNGDHGRALGLLGAFNAVVNCHGTSLHALMGQLRRLGVKTVSSLHLNDLTPSGRAVGHPYLTMAFEHAYDLIAPCSLQLADWCRGMGIPSEKVIPLLNAPSYAISPSTISTISIDRRNRSSSMPLRLLFLGRLDAQKGVERLNRLIQRTKSVKLPVEWRVVGKPVVSSSSVNLLNAIEPLLEPPVYTPEELTELFTWADALVMVSHYEGVPLTILEAMRLGVVPITTDVGAIHEVVQHRTNGIMLNTYSEDSWLGEIASLAFDRRLVVRLSESATQQATSLDWSVSANDLISTLARLI